MRGVVYLTDRLGVKDARTGSVGEEVHGERKGGYDTGGGVLVSLCGCSRGRGAGRGR
jgi:hypothetical protein